MQFAYSGIIDILLKLLGAPNSSHEQETVTNAGNVVSMQTLVRTYEPRDLVNRSPMLRSTSGYHRVSLSFTPGMGLQQGCSRVSMRRITITAHISPNAFLRLLLWIHFLNRFSIHSEAVSTALVFTAKQRYVV